MNINLTELLKDLLINIANILIMFIIVKALVYKPVKKFLDERKSKISAMKTEAENSIANANKEKEKYDELLKDAENIKNKSISDAEKEAENSAKEIIDAANAKAKAILDEAKEKSLKEREKILNEAKYDLASASISLTEKILKREVSDADNKKLAEEFIENLR